jgi:HEAT repeat protein
MTGKRELFQSGDRMAVQVDSVALQDSAIQIIAELGRENIAGYLKARIGEVVDTERRVDLITSYAALEKEGARTLLAYLARRISEPNEVRTTCLYWLGKIGGTITILAVRPALSDLDPSVRIAALRLVSVLPRMESIAQLKAALEHDSKEVQSVAASMLVDVEASEEFSLIERYFNDHPELPDARRALDFVARVKRERTYPPGGDYDQLYGEYWDNGPR